MLLDYMLNICDAARIMYDMLGHVSHGPCVTDSSIPLQSDATHKARASPSGLAGPSGAAVAPTGPGLSPLPSWMPPLGRLAEQVNAATASPSTSMLRTGTPSLTPLPLSNTVNAGHTPGPQKGTPVRCLHL